MTTVMMEAKALINIKDSTQIGRIDYAISS